MQATLGSKRGVEVFFATLVVLAFLRVILQSYADVPLWMLPVANIIMGALFLGGPLLALCFAARETWSRRLATMFVIGGIVLQVSCYLLGDKLVHHVGLMSQVFNALGQIGLPIWCVGLGALLATLIKDKNIVVPIAIFLAFLDMFLVFSPLGVTNRIIRSFPSMLPAIAVQVPRAVHEPAAVHVSPGTLAGPADFLFLAMFLVALFQFKMRARDTVLIVVPTLLAYMFVVTLTHFNLPALVPIGVVVLVVNWKEFSLTKDEKLSTALVTVLGFSLFVWGMFQKPKVVPPDSSQKADVQAPTKSPPKLEQDDSNRS